MHIFRPLQSAPVALLWSGLSFSAVGDQLYAIALTWIGIGVLGPNAGYLSALQALVVLLALLGIGRWADRWDQYWSMIGADLASAATLLAVVAWWLITGGVGAPQLVGAVVVLAIGRAVFQPALQVLLPSLVDDTRLLPAANGLLDATDRSARLLGPGFVALLSGVVPVMHFLTLDALSFIASATALLCIHRLRRSRRVLMRVDREMIWQGIVRGVRAMRGHPLLSYVLATTGPLNGAWYAVFYLGLPLMIEQHGVGGIGGNGFAAYGMVISSYGCTNLAATVVFGSRLLPVRPQFQIFGGNIVLGVGVVLLGLANFLPYSWLLPAFMASAALGAIGGPMQDIPVAVLRQTRLRTSDLAAAMRAHMAANSAGVLVAMLLVPTLIVLVGVVPVVVACGALTLGVGLGGLIQHAAWLEAAENHVR